MRSALISLLASTVGFLALVGVAVLGTMTKVSGGLKIVGTSLYETFGGDAAAIGLCNCDCRRLQILPPPGGKDDDFTEVPSFAPTFVEDWTVVWTEGLSSLSYVWVMTHEDVGVKAYVLVDTTGRAQGTTFNFNETSVNFVDDVGSIYRVDTDGSELTELVDYCTELSMGECEGYGLDAWDYTGKLYWVDKKLESLLSCNYDGTDLQVMITEIPDPYGVSIDKKAGHIYFTSAGILYGTSIFVSGGLTLNDVSVYYQPSSYDITNIGLDAENRYVYWTGNNSVYRGSITNGLEGPGSVDLLYGNVRHANSVSVDWQQSKIFFSDEAGVYYGSLTGSEDPVTVAYLYNVTFVYVRYEVTPTPAPTPVPTSKPSHCPTSFPTSIPTSTPTSKPTPVPTTPPSSRQCRNQV